MSTASTHHIDKAMAILHEVEAERLTATGRFNLSMAAFAFELARDTEGADSVTKLLNAGRGFLNSAMAADGAAKTVKVAEALETLKSKRTKRKERARLQ